MKRDLNEVSDDLIDLNPANWQSDRPKPDEPFFADGAVPALAYIIGFAVMITVVHYFR